MRQAFQMMETEPDRPAVASVKRGVAAPGGAIPLGPGSRRHCPDPCRGRQKVMADLLRKQFLSAPRLRCLWSHPAGLLPRGLS
ncbi:hypothetical protein LCGC14_1870010 [marine sediment metagenome]|uniref:Uncharacterized protein n=1 Tax=marine sediment metagenome TaxID=412755 RepID=A0A0F9G580_9ZZZZ